MTWCVPAAPSAISQNSLKASWSAFALENPRAEAAACRLPNWRARAETLWPGQFVNVEAQLNVERNRIVVPSRTVQTGPQGKYVWVMNPADATVAIRPVQVLRNYMLPKAGEEAVIGTGLRAGEMVISEGQMRLAPGMKVRLLQGQTQLGDAGAAATSGQS